MYAFYIDNSGLYLLPCPTICDETSCFYAEDLFDGLDNDGDGTIDEEVQQDYNGDVVPGIEGIDDDGDGNVDEVSNKHADDDEDGLQNE